MKASLYVRLSDKTKQEVLGFVLNLQQGFMNTKRRVSAKDGDLDGPHMLIIIPSCEFHKRHYGYTVLFPEPPLEIFQVKQSKCVEKSMEQSCSGSTRPLSTMSDITALQLSAAVTLISLVNYHFLTFHGIKKGHFLT